MAAPLGTAAEPMRVPVQRVPGLTSPHGKVIPQAPTLPWHHARVVFPEKGQGQGWWLCTQTCQLYKKDIRGDKLFFESATPNVPRPSSTVCYAGEVYAAAPTQLPADVRMKQRTWVDEDGVERPKFIKDYTNPDPNASLVPDWEYEHDPDTGQSKPALEVVGIAMFLELPDDMREAEGIVRHWRSNRTAPASMPLQEAREPWEKQQRDEAAAAFGIDNLGGQRKAVAAGSYQDALNAQPGADYEYEAQAAEQTLAEQNGHEQPPAQPQGSVMEQLAKEMGMPVDVVKAMLVKGSLAMAQEAMDEAQDVTPAQEPEPEPVAELKVLTDPDGPGNHYAGIEHATRAASDDPKDFFEPITEGAKVTNDKPWERQGISVAEWYRRRKRATEALKAQRDQEQEGDQEPAPEGEGD